MPVLLNTSPVAVSQTQETLSGVLADSYGVAASSRASGVGFVMQEAQVTEWAIAANTAVPDDGTTIAAYIRVGGVDRATTSLSIPQVSRTARAFGFPTVTLPTVTASLDGLFFFEGADEHAVHYTAPSLVTARNARTALRYTLTTDFTSALVGGGRVEALISKAASAGVYAVPGTPMTGRITQTNEAAAQVPWPCRGTFNGITVVAYSSSVTSGGNSPQFPTQFTLRVNGTDTGITATASGTGKVFSLSASYYVAFGDLVSLKVQALSWAAGSYFHGFAQLIFLPQRTVVPEPPPPPPFLGEQAPEGADLFFWQSVASYGGVSGWHMTGFLRAAPDEKNLINADQHWLALPYVFPRSATIAGLGVMVTGSGAGGEIARLSVWASRSSNNLYPGSLVADCGTVSLASTGLRTVTTSVGVQPSVFYFLGYVSSGFEAGGRTVRGYSNLTDNVLPLMGVASHASGHIAPLGWTITGSMTLPSVYPSSAAPVTDQHNMPAIAVKLVD